MEKPLMLKKSDCLKTLAIFFFFILPLTGTVKSQSFFPELPYNPTIPSPEDQLGFKAGDRAILHRDALDYLRSLADKSPRVRFFINGKTHEGRDLVYLIISSEENIKNLEKISKNISMLAYPQRSVPTDQIIKNTPAIAWMMYNIHGDELSGADAAIQLAYRLAAAADAETKMLLDNLIIGIDPFENPDGRERYLAQMQQWAGTQRSSDAQSIQHTSVWPWGRTNHYLFDLNRDWIIVSQPETRARVANINQWNPQLIIDAHEMGSYSSFLFNPPREPINPNIVPAIRQWWDIFAADQAHAFDEKGWSYYTKEWLEDWYPGYGSSWPCYRGAVGILYEQASYDGSIVKKPSCRISIYRDAVWRQLISSLANLKTAAENREKLLGDFARLRRQALQKTIRGNASAYLFEPGENPSRLSNFLERLIAQGIEVERLEKDVRIYDVFNYRTKKKENHQFSAGSFIVRANQPLQPLVHAILEPDPRMNTAFIQSERESLEKGRGTRMYEISSWSLPYAFDLAAFSSQKLPAVQSISITGMTKPVLKPVEKEPNFGFLMPYKDDSSIDALFSLLLKKYNARVAMKPFTVENRSYDRGTILIRRNENSEQLLSDLNQIIIGTMAEVIPANTGLCQKGPDLGGDEFRLLARPATALLTGPFISSYNFGALWYLLDYELKLPVSVLNHNRLNRLDLRKYNVLILPSGSNYEKIFNKKELKQLVDWIENGGTLIAIGGAAAFCADSSSGLSQVQLRRQALETLDEYAEAVQKELSLRQITVDSLFVWEGKLEQKKPSKTASAEKKDLKHLKKNDEFMRTFMPRGAIMRVELNTEHWLNFGMPEEVPAIFYSSYAFLSQKPVQTAGRFSDADNLRLSGLLWPEARERWSRTAYITREAKGKGQIILIAGEPNFRSYFYGTARLLINAILLGPGLGTRQTVPF
jgi:hypothetical protein